MLLNCTQLNAQSKNINNTFLVKQQLFNIFYLFINISLLLLPNSFVLFGKQ